MYRSLVHVRVPENLHGRAFAAGGLLVAVVGARGTLAYAGGLSALVGLIGLLALVRLKQEAAATETA